MANLGSIPAPAGKPQPHRTARATQGVYPRACGETDVDTGQADLEKGLSPRLRGNPFLAATVLPFLRSIPAPAGKPERSRPYVQGSWVYPRACGETP